METVGDKYMAVSGLPEVCDDHCRCIARLALDMMDLIKDVQVDGRAVVSKQNKFYFQKINWFSYGRIIFLCA